MRASTSWPLASVMLRFRMQPDRDGATAFSFYPKATKGNPMSARLLMIKRGEKAQLGCHGGKLRYLHCIKGKGRIVSRHCGVGWHITEGEYFLLRSGSSYSIAAMESIEIALHQDADTATSLIHI